MNRTGKLLTICLVLLLIVESVVLYNSTKQVAQLNKTVYGIYTDAIEISINSINEYRTSNNDNELYSIRNQLLTLDNIYGRVNSKEKLPISTPHYPPSALMDLLLSSHADTKIVNQYIDLVQKDFSTYLAGLNSNSYKNNTVYVQMWNNLQVETNQFKNKNKIGS